MVDPSIEACVKYESTLDVTKMEIAKIEFVTAANTVRSKKTPIFAAKHGVEGLYHVIDKFNKNADKLGYAIGDKWANFDEVLDQEALSKWENQIQNIAPQARTAARYEQELGIFVGEYAEGIDPRDKMIKYIKTCMKPFKKGNQEHANRMEVLIGIANRLQGTEPEIDNDNRKKIIFETFPSTWQDDFHKSGKTVATQELREIIAFMNICKKQADSLQERKPKRQKTDRIRGGGNQGNSGNTTKSNNSDRAPCPWPGHGRGHTWADCSKNPASKNYTGDQPYVSRGRGQGQGRGFGGRGGRGFGRGFGRGRGNYNNGNGSSGRGYQYSGQVGQGQQGTGGSYHSQQNNNQPNDNYFLNGQKSSNGNWNDMFHQEQMNTPGPQNEYKSNPNPNNMNPRW